MKMALCLLGHGSLTNSYPISLMTQLANQSMWAVPLTLHHMVSHLMPSCISDIGYQMIGGSMFAVSSPFACPLLL
jgi:hypothetical protein